MGYDFLYCLRFSHCRTYLIFYGMVKAPGHRMGCYLSPSCCICCHHPWTPENYLILVCSLMIILDYESESDILLTPSRNPLPALKCGINFAGTETTLPDFGLRPIRGVR